MHHANRLESVVGELRSIALSLPTQGIGVFPSYMSEVSELVKRATKSVTILCDTPAHGAFSNTAAFTDYWASLRHMMVDGNVKIECTFFDANGRKALHEAQIKADSDNWEAWQERNSKNCEAFDKLAKGKVKPPPPSGNAQSPVATWANTADAYVESMMAINEAVLSGFDGSVKVYELKFDDPLHEGPSVYLWLRDGDQEAVFVMVPVLGIGVQNLAGFHTREPELIHALSTVVAHLRK